MGLELSYEVSIASVIAMVTEINIDENVKKLHRPNPDYTSIGMRPFNLHLIF